MLKVLSERSATAVAIAGFTGLRLGEPARSHVGVHESARNEESLGWPNVTRSVWRSTVVNPKLRNRRPRCPLFHNSR